MSDCFDITICRSHEKRSKGTFVLLVDELCQTQVRHKVSIGVLLKPENIACTTEGPFHKAKAFFTGLKLDK